MNRLLFRYLFKIILNNSTIKEELSLLFLVKLCIIYIFYYVRVREEERMFDNIGFGGEIPTCRVESVDEALKKLPVYSEQFVRGSDLKIQLIDGSNVLLEVKGSPYNITEWGFSSLLQKLKLSPRSADNIETDLLEGLINNILNRSPDINDINVILRGDTIVNMGTVSHWMLKNRTILEKLALKSNGNIQQVLFSDRGLSINIVDDTLPVIEPKKGDVIQRGTSLRSSETYGELLCMESYLLRLVCTNGLTISQPGYRFAPRISRRKLYLSDIAYFEDDVKDFIARQSPVKDRIFNLVENEATDTQFLNVWKIMNRFSEPEVTDGLLGVNAMDRKEMTHAVSVRREENKSRLDKLSDEITKFNLYDLFNVVSARAKSVDYEESLELQRFSGNMLFWN